MRLELFADFGFGNDPGVNIDLAASNYVPLPEIAAASWHVSSMTNFDPLTNTTETKIYLGDYIANGTFDYNRVGTSAPSGGGFYTATYDQTLKVDQSTVTSIAPFLSGFDASINVSFEGGISVGAILGKTVSELITDGSVIVGTARADSIKTTDAAEFIQGGDGNDTIDGRGGDDTALFSGASASYAISENSNGTFTVRHLGGTGSSDTIANIENVQFDDITFKLNHAPKIALPVEDQAATEDTEFSFVVSGKSFSDTDPDTALIYSATQANGNPLPAWLVFDPETRAFYGTSSNADVGSISVKITASDGVTSVSDTFNIAVANTNDAPTGAFLSAETVKENAQAGTVVGLLSGADVDLGDTLTFELVENPDDTFDIVNGKLVVAEGASLDFETAKTHKIIISVSDSEHATFQQSFNISVMDVKEPIVGSPRGDNLVGTKSADQIFGLADNDLISGQAGNDMLDGGKGNDKLTGGAGADTFVFANGYGKDTITDLVLAGKGHDFIDLSDLSSATDIKDLKANHLSDHGNDVWVEAGKNDVLIIKGHEISDLVNGDFLF